MSQIYNSCSDCLAHQACPEFTKVAPIAQHMHPQSGMDLKTLAKHFPGLSIQTNSVKEPSSPRRDLFRSADPQRCSSTQEYFFYVKIIYFEQILTSQQIGFICGKISERNLCKCTAKQIQSPQTHDGTMLKNVNYIKAVQKIWFSHRKIFLALSVRQS